MAQKTITISERSRCDLLHIEAPGCIINIRVGLTDVDGRKVTNVSVMANGDRYAGDPEWWIEGDKLARHTGTMMRVVCTGWKGGGLPVTNAKFFQTLIDQTDAHIGVDSSTEATTGLWHLLACAHDWCGALGLDFDATLADVREQLALEEADRRLLGDAT